MQNSQLIKMIHPWCRAGGVSNRCHKVVSNYAVQPGGPTLAVQSWLMLHASLTIRGDNTHHVIKSPQNQLDLANNRVFASEARRVYS